MSEPAISYFHTETFVTPAHEAPTEEPALRRLQRLRDEVVEIARLANILGRTPAAAAALCAGCILSMIFFGAGTSAFALGLWALFVGAASIALMRLYRQSMRSAFELLALRAFVLDLHAVLLYAGFAWGAGAFLVLPASGNATELIAIAIGGSLIMAAILRASTAALYFLVPATFLPALSALSGAAGFGVALMLLIFGGGLAAGAEWAEKLTARHLGTVTLS